MDGELEYVLHGLFLAVLAFLAIHLHLTIGCGRLGGVTIDGEVSRGSIWAMVSRVIVIVIV